MKSIYSKFKGLYKDGRPIDFLATWRKAFDKASEREVALFQKMYSDNWFTYNTPQMSLTAEGIMGKYRLRFMATLLADESPTLKDALTASIFGLRRYPVWVTSSLCQPVPIAS